MLDIEGLHQKEYPKIKGFCKNAYYAGLLQNLYAGTESETVLFLQFRYQSYILSQFNEQISRVLNDVALCELKHQELLAHAIQITGGDPIFACSQGKWLGGRQIDYIKDTKSILQINLEAKEKSIIDYKLAISKIDNTQIKLLLTAILSDEENHRLIFKKLLKNLT